MMQFTHERGKSCKARSLVERKRQIACGDNSSETDRWKEHSEKSGTGDRT